MPPFKLVSKFRPSGDQPQAIEKLVKNLEAGAKHQVLLGVTGSGKTFTMANVIERIQKPTLVISHNKTLAAQLYQEFKEFFPQNEVHYFVSYYDYYQPEAYIPQSDIYIEKDAKINDEIDRLRHAATQALLSRNDTIVVASVSCIYNIGSPRDYLDLSLELEKDQKISRQNILRHLVSLQYERNNVNFKRGSFRVLGEILEIWPSTGQEIIKIEMAGEKISQIFARPTRNAREIFQPKEISKNSVRIFPAKFWVAPQESLTLAEKNIKAELDAQIKKLKKQKKILEAERLRRRTNFDLEMMKEAGYCHGIENYSRHLEFRASNEAPFTLMDYFFFSSSDGDRPLGRDQSLAKARTPANNFLTIIDESHMTIPQIGGMYFGDRSRKETLIEYGFRLPSALDNRPLKFEEFEKRTGQIIYTSATPGKYEMEKTTFCRPALDAGSKEKRFRVRPACPVGRPGMTNDFLVEQLIRPTGLLDPQIDVRPAKNQIPDLIKEIKGRVAKGQRTLATTLTKRMAENLADYLNETKIKTHYLHSEIKTLERPEILRDFRLGKYDAVVGINLLREGLDLPEVSLVAILDADKEGFLRNETTLIQTMGRASRHLEGKVIMYADKITFSMKRAIEETNRRRKIQADFNKKHHQKPQPIKKDIRENIVEIERPSFVPLRGTTEGKAEQEYLKEYLKELEFKAELASRNLQFDEAIKIKEEIKNLKNLQKDRK